MKKVRIDITGQKYGRLTVLNYAYTKNKIAHWKCKCDCGNIKVVKGPRIKNGDIKSCGCLRRELARKKSTKHGQHGTRLYNIWKGVMNRCNTKGSSTFYKYGGRGIKVVDEWINFDNFKKWALDNGYKDNLTIERIDVNGNYEPDNCKWIPAKEQHYNKRTNITETIDGENKTLAQWAEQYGIKKSTIYARYKRGKRGRDLIKAVK